MNFISLVGEQPLPNLLPIRHYKVSEVCLVHTSDEQRSKKSAENLKAVLEVSECKVKLLEVDAYNIVEIQKTLEGYVEASHSACMFNITGGTKPMSVAAYAVASAKKIDYCYLETAPKESTIYHYSWQDELSNLERQKLNANIIIDEFLTLRFGQKGIGWKPVTATLDNKGSRFEKIVADAIKPHFDEIKCNTVVHNGQLEVDLIIRQGDRFLILELKSGKENYNKAVRQLHTAGLLLGLYTQKIYVGTSFQKEWDLDPWKATGIEFHELPELPDGSISESDLQSLITLMNQKLKK